MEGVLLFSEIIVSNVRLDGLESVLSRLLKTLIFDVLIRKYSSFTVILLTRFLATVIYYFFIKIS